LTSGHICFPGEDGELQGEKGRTGRGEKIQERERRGLAKGRGEGTLKREMELLQG
jgi:hypothetical protein